ncbi:hypothetical protein PVAG01_11489 [Phlyctema vagabunda]|uniref:CCHC-type domain-containing protein n=1 Tax=Phlyctema vagabunda TaxID=108571 RepID=A0ABR4P1S6_9HELO
MNPSGQQFSSQPHSGQHSGQNSTVETAGNTLCGNCGQLGHNVKGCFGPVDAYGAIAACPHCNTKSHTLDTCYKASRRSIGHYLVQRRINMAPIKTGMDWRTMPDLSAFAGHPWSLAYSLEQSRKGKLDDRSVDTVMAADLMGAPSQAHPRLPTKRLDVTQRTVYAGSHSGSPISTNVTNQLLRGDAGDLRARPPTRPTASHQSERQAGTSQPPGNDAILQQLARSNATVQQLIQTNAALAEERRRLRQELADTQKKFSNYVSQQEEYARVRVSTGENASTRCSKRGRSPFPSPPRPSGQVSPTLRRPRSPSPEDASLDPPRVQEAVGTRLQRPTYDAHENWDLDAMSAVEEARWILKSRSRWFELKIGVHQIALVPTSSLTVMKRRSKMLQACCKLLVELQPASPLS